MERIVNQRSMIRRTGLLLLLMVTLCLAMNACNDGGEGQGTTENSADTSGNATMDDTTSAETSALDVPVFEPDPLLSVPQYDSLLQNLDSFPFRFTYGGKDYAGFDGFSVSSQLSTPIERGIETLTVLTHPDINAVFELVSRVYPEESAYEYVIYIKNTSDTNTELFKNPEFSITFTGDYPVVSGLQGDAGSSWYQEYEKNLVTVKEYSQVSTSGRPTHVTFPYFNLSYGAKDRTKGTFIAVGWSGTWRASFTYQDGETTLVAGQNKVNTYIAPGETLRTPLMAFVEYEGKDSDEQTNAWRHYFINDVMPHPDGELPQSVISSFMRVVQGDTEEKILKTLKMYALRGIQSNGLWIDAGWYGGTQGEAVGWSMTGTQIPDAARFPEGLAPLGDYCAQNDMEFLLWFEPEIIRLDRTDFLATQEGFKEEWMLGRVMTGTWLEGELFDMSNPEAREWLLGRVCHMIDTAGITVYRQDFNGDPAEVWAANDTKDRTGMTENQYVQGYLAYWDTLLEKYPHLLIDSCASGGGRNDLETMKRSVPLHYSDLFDGGDDNYTEKTRMTQSLFAWIPYFKNENHGDGLYNWRINLAPWSVIRFTKTSPMMPDADWDTLRQVYAEYEQIKGYFYADYYQLTEYSTNLDRWNAWEFYDPATRSGYASLSCNPDSSHLTQSFCLKGLEADTVYQVTDFDGLVHVTATGRELMEEGITVTVPEAPYCVLLLIKPQS